MPILRLNSKGEVYQTDSREDGEVGIGHVAQMGEDSNMLEMSVVEDPKILADRALSKKQTVDAQVVAQTLKAVNFAKEAAADFAQQAQADAGYRRMKAQAESENEAITDLKLKAIFQNADNSNYDVASARRSMSERPSMYHDYAPVIPAAEAFGECMSFGLYDEGSFDFGAAVALDQTPKGEDIYASDELEQESPTWQSAPPAAISDDDAQAMEQKAEYIAVAAENISEKIQEQIMAPAVAQAYGAKNGQVTLTPVTPNIVSQIPGGWLTVGLVALFLLRRK